MPCLKILYKIETNKQQILWWDMGTWVAEWRDHGLVGIVRAIYQHIFCNTSWQFCNTLKPRTKRNKQHILWWDMGTWVAEWGDHGLVGIVCAIGEGQPLHSGEKQTSVCNGECISVPVCISVCNGSVPVCNGKCISVCNGGGTTVAAHIINDGHHGHWFVYFFILY